MTDNNPPQSSTDKLVAPLWHTGLILLVFLAVTLLGFYSQRNSLTDAPPSSSNGKVFLYLSVIALQYGLLRLIISGLRRKGITLGTIIGGKGNDWRALGFDFVIAVLFLIAGTGVLRLIKLWLGGVDNHTGGLLPTGILESLLWIVVSMAAGFVEEICYRGYLQKQILALTGSATAAILLQAFLFGISHSYQGIKSSFVVFTYGAMFGLLAYWLDSLRPGIIAHALTDIIGGLI